MERQKQDNCFNIYYFYFDDASIKKMLDEMESFDPKVVYLASFMGKQMPGKIIEIDGGDDTIKLY